jgi:hypothetical protein
MADSSDRDSRRGSIIWEEDSMICASYMFAPDDFEITLTLNGDVIQRERFSDTERAMKFVIDTMRAHAAR